ncbi:MAG: twin-arginine translocation signal domain-containing protein, partial [Pirellula staleyi]
MRRDFLKWCASAGIGLATPSVFSGNSRADDKRELPIYDGPFYVVCNASGGWDTTYLMDPKGVGGINRLYEKGDIQTERNIPFAPTAKHIAEGMSNEQFFSKYANELLVVNGLDYSINNHSSCSRYMATGNL